MLQSRRASFDRLRMRFVLHGPSDAILDHPHPELVEGRTTSIQDTLTASGEIA
jgi:hypothetical protein